VLQIVYCVNAKSEVTLNSGGAAGGATAREPGLTVSGIDSDTN